jgi:hypothetical protein
MVPDARGEAGAAAFGSWPAVTLMVLLAIAALCSVYRLDEQSLWLDEWASIVDPPDATFGDHMERIRIYNPDHVPLYFVLDFLWTRVAGSSVFAQRIFSVGLHLLSVALVFVLGRSINNRTAILGTLLFTLSPYHIHLGQSLRPYALLIPLALGATIVTLHMLERPHKAWWPVLFLLHALMLWTHLTASFVILAHLSVLALREAGGRKLPLYPVLHGLLLIPFLWGGVLFLQGISAIPESTFTPPGWDEVLRYCLHFDLPYANIELLPAVFSLPGILAGATVPLTSIFGWVLGGAFSAAILSAASLTGRRLLRQFKTGKKQTPTTAHRDPFRSNCGNSVSSHAEALYLALAVLPVAAVLTVTCVVSPLFMPRFTATSTIFLYLLLGAALSRLPRALYMAGSAALAVAYLLMTTATINADTRTQWLQLARDIAPEIRKGDIFACKDRQGFSVATSSRILQHYLGNGQEVLPAASFLQGVQFAFDFFQDKPNRLSTVWLVQHHRYEMQDMTAFENIMRDCGMDFVRTDYPAMGKLSLYEISLGENRAPHALQNALEKYIDPAAYAPVLQGLGINPESHEAAKARAAIALAYDLVPPPVPAEPADAAEIAGMIAMASPTIAQRVLHVAAAMDDDAIFAHFHLAALSMAAGDVTTGVREFEECLDALTKLDEWETLRDLLIEMLEAVEARDCRRVAEVKHRLGEIGVCSGPRLAWDRPRALGEALQKYCGVSTGKAPSGHSIRR